MECNGNAASRQHHYDLSAVGADPEWDGLASAFTTLLATEIEIHPDGRQIAAAIVRVRINYFSPLWEV